MSTADEARAYINQKHPWQHDNGVGIVQGSHYRSGFVDGAEWQASRTVEVTDGIREKSSTEFAGLPTAVQYGRRNRESGKFIALGGHPLPEWWDESQETYEHVQRLVSSWAPIPAEVDPWVDPEPWVDVVIGKRAVHPLPQKYYRYAPRTHLEYNTEQEGTKP